MATFSYHAAKTWSKDHTQIVLQDIEQDIEQTETDYERETGDYGRKVCKEKIEELKEDKDYLRSLLGM